VAEVDEALEVGCVLTPALGEGDEEEDDDDDAVEVTEPLLPLLRPLVAGLFNDDHFVDDSAEVANDFLVDRCRASHRTSYVLVAPDDSVTG
jgi:hypothetical protein